MIKAILTLAVLVLAIVAVVCITGCGKTARNLEGIGKIESIGHVERSPYD